VSRILIRRTWTPTVRYAARRYRRDVRRAARTYAKTVSKGGSEGEAMSVLCAEEAKAVLDMLKRLGYGGGRRKAPTRQRLELEVMVHERDESASINFFRLFLAQQKGKPLDQYFSKKGRERTRGEAEALRWKHIDELRDALRARDATYQWLSRYFKRIELARKYTEFAKVQFDEALDNDAKVTFMALLIAQIAQRTGRSNEDVLAEYNELIQGLGLDVASAEIDVGGDGPDDGPDADQKE
jgi:hypothetical protein